VRHSARTELHDVTPGTSQKPAAGEGGHELLQPKGRLCADAHAVGLVSDARANCTLRHTQGGCESVLAKDTAWCPCKNTHTQHQGVCATPAHRTQGTGVHQHAASSKATKAVWDCCAHLFISTSADLDL